MKFNKAISISLAKVDYDFGQPYIKIIANNPHGYQFTKCIVEVHSITDGKWNDVKRFDISTLFESKNDIVLSLPVSSLDGLQGPAIYHLFLTAQNPDNGYHEIFDELFLSDVHGVYRHMLGGLLESDKCAGVDDDLIKKYLLLYGHQAALQAGDLDIAKEYFLLMHKGMSKCNNASKTINCGCNG